MHDKWTGPELDSLLGSRTLTRRQMLVTSLATGFALAAQPVAADAITTSTEGLEAGEVRIPVADGEIPAYRAMPAKGRDFPVVLVVQEIFGVHEHIKDVCRRFARQGYLAIAPELYARQGDVSKMTDWKQIFAEVVSKVPDAQVMSDLDATVAWAREDRAAATPQQARDHRLLLGRAHHLALRGAQSRPEGGRRLVRALVGARRTALQPKYPLDVVAEHQRAGAGAVRRQGPGHSARGRRRDARGAQGGGQAVGDHRVPGSRSRASSPTTARATARTTRPQGWAACLGWFRKHGVG